MRKVLIIGKLNDIIKQLSEALSKQYRVQVCADNESVVESMLNVLEPDLVVSILMGAPETQPERAIAVLSGIASVAPVIAVGPGGLEKRLTEEGILKTGRIRYLRRPVKLEEVVQWVQELLPSGEPGKRKKLLKEILVVDDNPSLLRTMQNMLSRYFHVTFATSGPQAIMAISRSKPDLILLDYDMPVCDGKMTLQMLRSEKTTRDIPVVFLTGMSDPVHVGEVLSLHPQGYLLKPPSEEKIFAAIRGILGDDVFDN